MENFLPNENIDPRLKKQPDFLLKYAKACLNTAQTGAFIKIFYRNQSRYEEIMDYFLGTQTITKYKPLMGVDEADNDTWLKIDWTVRKIGMKFFNIAIAKCMERMYNTNCTPIDPIAKSDLDEYFAGLQAKIVMKDVLKKIGSPLQQAAAVQPQAGEPQDMQELQMMKEFGAKTELCKEAEIGIEVVFNENDIMQQRRQQIQQLLCYGFGIYKDYHDENMRVKHRVADGRFFGCNYCRKRDFSDMTQAWEIIEVPLSDIAVIFKDPKIIEEIKNNSANRNYATGGAIGTRGWVQGFDPNKARVMDLEFISYDTVVKETGVDPMGNIKFSGADYQYRNNTTKKVAIGGKEQNAYSSKRVKNVYKVKWIIGTDYVYDYGLANNMKIDNQPGMANDVRLSYHVMAPDFHEMKAYSIGDALIPVLDEFQMTVYRIQQFKNRWLPYIVSIDMGALEDVAIGKGGAAMTPRALLNMLFQTNILVARKRDLGGATGNNKSVEVESTNMASEFEVLANDLKRILQDIRDLTGLNEVTDGSSPNERNLNSTNEAAIMGTNNALSPIIEADKWLLESLAKGVFQRLQISVSLKGNYAGYYDSLGSNSLSFFTVSKDICLHYYGIKLEERMSDPQRQALLQFFQEDIANGLLNTPDIYMITSMYNTKQAWQYLSYRVERNKQMQLQEKQASEAQMGQTAVALEKEKQKTQQDKIDGDIKKINVEKAWDVIIAETQGTKQINQVMIQEAMKIVGLTVAPMAQAAAMPPDGSAPPAQAPQGQQPPIQPPVPQDQGQPEMAQQ